MKAVVWSDVLQMVIIFIGLIIIVTKTTIDSGGNFILYADLSKLVVCHMQIFY